MISRYLLGIDLGGTKVEVAVIHAHSLEVVHRHRIDSMSHLPYEDFIQRIATFIKETISTQNLQLSHIGMGTPGAFDPITRSMKNCNTTILNGHNLPADLNRLLGIEVRVSNDANCFAIAEAKLGIVPDILPDARTVFGVIMGTGVGGGIVIDGKVLHGRQGIGGEWGHNFLDESGGPCYCGKSGCVEMVISGPALERYYQMHSGRSLKMKDILSNYRDHSDPIAVETIERLFTSFGRAISVVINILDPDVIVIGGGLGNIDELYTRGVAEVKSHVFNHRLDTIFCKPKLGDSAGVFGAAFL
jgi:fructokinase